MKSIRCIFTIFLPMLVLGCAVSNQLKQLDSDASTSFHSGDYIAALDAYEQIIHLKTQNRKSVEGMVYKNAGLSAWGAKNTTKAIDYLEKAKSTTHSDAKVHYTLARAYLEIDNLSKELNNLEAYMEQYSNHEDIAEVRCMIFTAYAKSENWERADAVWTQLDETCQSHTHTLEGYMRVSEKLEYFDRMNSIAMQLLKLDSHNCSALETLAMYYYRKADSNYQVEMNAYKNNRTTRQYNQLLKALDEINANFRTSRDYFERLYKLDPQPRYAHYLGNIYTRFENKKQADYYYRKAKGI